MKSGCRLGLDYWADTGFPDKHPYVDEFIDGKGVNVTGFTYTLVSIDNLPIAHVLYTFDKDDETVVFIEHNNTIYMGDDMIDPLDKPIHCEDNDVRIDLHPKVNDPNNNNAQSTTLPYGSSISVDYDGVLP